MTQLNETSLDTLCGALCYALGIEPPAQAAPANEALCKFIDTALEGKKCDRIFMYNPDAVAQWLFEKYPAFFEPVVARTQLQLPLRSPMPSVTPVCFGTMYTGAQPQVHGIQKYEKPVITIDTIFDALLRAGKKCAILACGTTCSLAKIFLQRDMDYYLYEDLSELNAQAAKLILEDRHDFIVCYNGNYDSFMHKNGTESPVSLAELRCNTRGFAVYHEMIRANWTKHRTLVGFAMDHGCHDIDAGCGSHGLDMAEDLNICHLYSIVKGEEA